ncbi:secondary thiamine-phosphate synthase enzyme YjbQ [Elusimicrobiota bacterium]
MEREQIQTVSRNQFIDITGIIDVRLQSAKIRDGVCVVFIPHTTAGISINENADPDVIRDINMMLDELIPLRHRSFKHMEGNSAAHIKASLMGSSVKILVENGRLKLGTWQSVFFCEFDGPRSRNVWIEFMPAEEN